MSAGPAVAVIFAPIVSAPLAIRLTKPVPVVLIAPLVLSAPVLFTVVVPLPAWLIPVTVSVPAVFVSAMLPLVVLAALNALTVCPKSSTVPPTEALVSVVPVIAPESVIAPPACKVTVLVVPIITTSKPVASR